MRLVTGNKFVVDQYNEISIHIFLNGYSFIVKNVSREGVKVIINETFNHHDLINQINFIDLDIHNVKVIWDNDSIKLVPQTIFDKLYNDTTYNFVDNNWDSEIVATWNGDADVIEQINYLFHSVEHCHVLQKMVCDKNVVKIIQTTLLTYIVVMGNSGLENYIVASNAQAADILYFIKKLVKNESKYRFQIIGNDKNILSTIEQYINVNATLSNDPIMMICE